MTETLPTELRARLARIRLLVCDVDGTLTDGGVFYDHDGGETKRFHIHDGLGIVLASLVGLRIAWITGRSSPMVTRRARELGVALLRQEVRDKATELARLAVETQVPPLEIAYIGDDLNDLPAIRAAAAAFAPADAVAAVRAEVDIVTARAGGQGAVRDAIDILLNARGDYTAAVAAYLETLAAAGSARRQTQ